MRDVPIPVILSWPTPNYIDPLTRGDALVVINAVLISVVVIVVSLRLYTRLAIRRWFGADDTFIALALVTTIALTTCVILANERYCWGRHVWDIPLSTLPSTSKIAFAAKILYTLAATFTRLSIFSFYYRLVHDSGKQIFTWAIHANVAFTIGILITFICLTIFQCNPISAYWTYGSKGCMDEGPVTLAAGVINTVADFLATVLPIPMVMRLQMPLRQRVAVLVLFSLGFIVTAAGAARTWFIYRALMQSYDETWYAYSLWISAAVEIDLGVICASAPVLKPLLARLPLSLSGFSARLSSRSRTQKSSKQQSAHIQSQSNNHNHPQDHYRSLSDQALGKSESGLSSTNPQRQNRTESEREREADELGLELKQWDDTERGEMWHPNALAGGCNGSISESQVAMLENGEERERAMGWRPSRTDQENREREMDRDDYVNPGLGHDSGVTWTRGSDGSGGGVGFAK